MLTDCRYAECHYAECHHAECHNAECQNAECLMINVMQNAELLCRMYRFIYYYA